MASIADYILDAALSKLDLEANAIFLTSAEATTYAEATSALALGNSTALSIAAPADRAEGGREVNVAEITDGDITGSGTVTHYAIVDTVNTRLLVTGVLSVSQVVTAGNTFSLATFSIGIPDPV